MQLITGIVYYKYVPKLHVVACSPFLHAYSLIRKHQTQKKIVYVIYVIKGACMRTCIKDVNVTRSTCTTYKRRFVYNNVRN